MFERRKKKCFLVSGETFSPPPFSVCLSSFPSCFYRTPLQQKPPPVVKVASFSFGGVPQPPPSLQKREREREREREEEKKATKGGRPTPCAEPLLHSCCCCCCCRWLLSFLDSTTNGFRRKEVKNPFFLGGQRKRPFPSRTGEKNAQKCRKPPQIL